jgi:hypothetical protein
LWRSIPCSSAYAMASLPISFIFLFLAGYRRPSVLTYIYSITEVLDRVNDKMNKTEKMRG